LAYSDCALVVKKLDSFKLQQIFDDEPQSWRELELYILQAFTEMGYHTSKGLIDTVRGRVEIDVIARSDKSTLPSMTLCECKFWDRKVSQNVIHSFRATCSDAGANLGLVISKNGFQKGAEEKRRFTNVGVLTFSDFQKRYFDEWKSSIFMTLERMRDEILPLFRAQNGMEEYGTDLVKQKVVEGKGLEEKYWILWGTPVSKFFIQNNPFPFEVVDPRGPIEQKNKILLKSHREFLEICREGMLCARAQFGLPEHSFDGKGFLRAT